MVYMYYYYYHYYKQGGSLLHPICIFHHVDLATYLHAYMLQCCKQGCERADLAAMKRS